MITVITFNCYYTLGLCRYFKFDASFIDHMIKSSDEDELNPLSRTQRFYVPRIRDFYKASVSIDFWTQGFRIFAFCKTLNTRITPSIIMHRAAQVLMFVNLYCLIISLK